MTMKHEDVDYHQDELLRKRNQYENTAHNHHTTNSFLEHFQLPLSSIFISQSNSFEKIEVEISLGRQMLLHVNL